MIFLDVEAVRSPEEFAEKVCVVRSRLGSWNRPMRRVLVWLEPLRGAKLGPFQFPRPQNRPAGYWKRLMSDAVGDLVEQQAKVDKRVVFCFDEMPWMLSAIAEKDSSTAAQVLDLLRELRQSPDTGPGFRLVMCGSTGMHHVLDDLHRRGYRNKPVNDLMLVEVPPLAPDVAAELAGRLLAGEGMQADPAAAGRVADATGGFPYYVQWVVRRLADTGGPVTPNAVDAAVAWLLTAYHDPCDLRHFRSRIPSYYPGDEKAAVALLDHAAVAPAPVPVAELINVARSAGDVDDERIRDLTRRLALDHYLARDTDGRYAFRHALLRRWWALDRGLN